MKKILLFLVSGILILFIFGCSVKSSLYEIDNEVLYQSSEEVYDYSYSLNDQWNITYSDEELVTYKNEENDVCLSFIKINYDNKKFGTVLDSKELPLLFSEHVNREIDFRKLKEEKSRTDYQSQFKFRYSRGQLNDWKYQLIYFVTDHIIPSVSGEKVANCIVITYIDEKDEVIDQFLTSIEDTIHYE